MYNHLLTYGFFVTATSPGGGVRVKTALSKSAVNRVFFALESNLQHLKAGEEKRRLKLRTVDLPVESAGRLVDSQPPKTARQRLVAHVLLVHSHDEHAPSPLLAASPDFRSSHVWLWFAIHAATYVLASNTAHFGKHRSCTTDLAIISRSRFYTTAQANFLKSDAV